MLDNESSDENDVSTDSVTLHTTASDSSEIKSSFLSDESLKPNEAQDLTQDISIPQPATENITESQFSSSMPYLEGLDQTDDVTKDSAVISDENKLQKGEDEEIEDPPGPRRHTKSSRSHHPEIYGKDYAFNALSPNASNQPWYNCMYSYQYYGYVQVDN